MDKVGHSNEAKALEQVKIDKLKEEIERLKYRVKILETAVELKSAS